MSNYRLRPSTKINASAFNSYEQIISYIKEQKNKKIVIETYPGVDLEELKSKLVDKIDSDKVFFTEDTLIEDIDEVVKGDLTEDRIFTRFTTKNYEDFFNKESHTDMINAFGKSESGIIYGPYAYPAISKDTVVLYFDMPRWEIQLRYRKNMKVFLGNLVFEDKLMNFKRGYFLDWRMADRVKEIMFDKVDLFVDTTKPNKPVSITADTWKESLDKVVAQPFRLVPYFDAGVWGGTWMEEKFDLGKNEFSKWAWSFDGVPEENSLLFQYGDDYLEMPAMNATLFRSKELLGNHVIKRFGKEFPIRFDYLDTMDGQNLSLQIHPSDEYMKENFGGNYSQNESYYFMDVADDQDVFCYLGVKNGTTPESFVSALEEAQETGKFDDEKFVNRFTVKKHDHLLHPSGVVHSSGSGGVVLEISSTPYIFTFKLWDWGRLGLDGKPRPINIERAKTQIDYTADETFSKNELVNAFKVVHDSDDYLEEKTGLHERQFIETRRFTFKDADVITVDNHDSVNMLNLVEGESAIIESVDNSFEPYTVFYAETFIVPESVGKYNVRRSSDKTTMLFQAFVRKQ